MLQKELKTFFLYFFLVFVFLPKMVFFEYAGPPPFIGFFSPVQVSLKISKSLDLLNAFPFSDEYRSIMSKLCFIKCCKLGL